MRHKEVQEKLLLYLDNELADKEMKQVSEHLSACPECSRERDLLASVWNTEDVRQKEALSPFVWTRLEACIKEYDQTSGRKRSLKKIMRYVSIHPIGAAASVIAVAFGIYIGTAAFHEQASKYRIQSSSYTVTDELKLNLFDLVPYDTPGSELVGRIEAQK